jgi:hypothetical protein
MPCLLNVSVAAGRMRGPTFGTPQGSTGASAAWGGCPGLPRRLVPPGRRRAPNRPTFRCAGTVARRRYRHWTDTPLGSVRFGSSRPRTWPRRLTRRFPRPVADRSQSRQPRTARDGRGRGWLGTSPGWGRLLARSRRPVRQPQWRASDHRWTGQLVAVAIGQTEIVQIHRPVRIAVACGRDGLFAGLDSAVQVTTGPSAGSSAGTVQTGAPGSSLAWRRLVKHDLVLSAAVRCCARCRSRRAGLRPGNPE